MFDQMAKTERLKVVAIDLFWVSLWLFRVMEYISDELNSYTPRIQFSPSQGPKLF